MELQDALEEHVLRNLEFAVSYEGDTGQIEAFRVLKEAATLVANAVPVVRMGGLSPAYYITDDPTEADAWLIEVKPKEL